MASSGLPRLDLHIGTNKTGTSAIQRQLHRLRRDLRGAGVLYPETGRPKSAHYDLSRVLGAKGRKTLPLHAAERAELHERLQREFAASGCSRLIVSSEDFMLCRELEPVREFFAGFDCRIVVYLRRHDHWWQSAYSQAVRIVSRPPWQRGILPYIRYAKKHSPLTSDYGALLERWAAAFGADRLCVRPYETEQMPRGAAADFLAALDLAELADVAAAAVGQRVNESPDWETLAYIEILQRVDIDDALRAELMKRLLAAAVPATGAGPMGPRLRRRLVLENREAYAHIARHYLGRADGRLFLEPEPDAQEAWQAPPVPNAIEAAARFIRLMQERRFKAASLLPWSKE